MGGRVLIVYGSSYGQTAKVAERLRDWIAAGGCDVMLVRGDQLPAWLCLGDFDGVLVGGSVIGGKYQSYIHRFITDHRDALNRLPSAFFAVSGSAGSPLPEPRAAAVHAMELFLAQAGWRPRLTASIAGAMTYSRYNPFLRFVMRRIARQNGATDTRHDREYTDWVQVRRLANDFTALLPRHATAAEGEREEVRV